MNILVTGGAGFIGSHVVDALIEQGHRVTVMDDMSGGFASNVHPDATFRHAAVDDHNAVEDIFVSGKFKAVYHIAAYAAEGLSPFIRRFNYVNNLIGSVNVINACINHGVDVLVFTSSIAVYGNAIPPFTEEMRPTPMDPYGISKAAVEDDIRSAHETHRLNYVIFRPFNVYGPRQNLSDPYRNVVGIFMRACREGSPIKIFGDGSQKRAFTYIDDVAPTMASVVSQPDTWNETYNIGSSSPVKVMALAEMVRGAMQSNVPIEFMPARHEAKVAYCSRAKAQARLTAHPSISTPLHVGIQRMAEWASTTKLHARSGFGSIEIEAGLPESWRTLL